MVAAVGWVGEQHVMGRHLRNAPYEAAELLRRAAWAAEVGGSLFEANVRQLCFVNEMIF